MPTPLLPVCRRLAPFLVAVRQNNPHAPKEFTSAIDEMLAALATYSFQNLPATPHLRVLNNPGDPT